MGNPQPFSKNGSRSNRLLAKLNKSKVNICRTTVLLMDAHVLAGKISFSKTTSALRCDRELEVEDIFILKRGSLCELNTITTDI